MRMAFRLAPSVFLAAITLSSGAQPIPEYDVVTIGSEIPGATGGAATAVNESGDVAGYVSIVSAWEHTAFVYTDELGPILLPSPDWAVTARALDISNRLGDNTVEVVGWAANSIYSGDLAVAWRVSVADGTVLDLVELGTLPGLVQSQARAVNSHGDRVGYSAAFMQFGGPATWFREVGPERISDLYTAVAVSESRIVLTGPRFNGTSSVLHDLNTGDDTDLGVPPGLVRALGTDLNDVGSVAATMSTPDTDPRGQYIKQAWRYTDGAGWEYLFGGGNALDAATGINNHGDVIGQLLIGLSYVDILYLQEMSTAYDVETLLTDPTVDIDGLNDINDLQMIATSGPGGPVLLMPRLTVSVATLPEVRTLRVSSSPNPFRPQTTIHYSVPDVSSVDLRIYDPAGRLVRELVRRSVHTIGNHSIVWDGRDAAGRRSVPGVYFVRLEAAGQFDTRRVVRIR